MTIEFSNTIEPKNHSAMGLAIVITACALFFIPTTLIILGYYSSQPTGTLVSPLPQTTLGQTSTPTPTPIPSQISPTETPENNNQPIIAADNTATNSADSEVATNPGSNIIDKTATLPAGQTEVIVKDADVTEATQIYLSPRTGDKAIYSLKSKQSGQFTIVSGDTTDTVRYIDYSIVNP